MTRSDRMYTNTPCDKCGGPTIDFSSGSIWCPAEDPHPGGHFVVRVAFERAPKSMADLRDKSVALGGERSRPKRSIVSRPAGLTVETSYDKGMDDFVRSDK